MSFRTNPLITAADQLDAKIAELENIISTASSEAQVRVSRDLKRAWESVYNALGYSPNPSRGVHAHHPHTPANPSSHTAARPNVPLEPNELPRCTPAQGTQLDLAAIAGSTQCDICKEQATDVLWVCISCQGQRMCNKCKSSSSSGSSGIRHRLVAWPINQSTVKSGHYIVCDSCDKPVVGIRWKCDQCDSFDLCNDCHNKTTHKHPLTSQYLAETSLHPLGVVGYSCNICDSSISPPVFCCLKCTDYHVCASCAAQSKMCDHDFAAINLPLTSAAIPRPADHHAQEAAASSRAANEPESAEAASDQSKQAPEAKPQDHGGVWRHHYPFPRHHGHCSRAESIRARRHMQPLVSAVCDECSQPIPGIRHKCTRCKDYDLCDNCYRQVAKVHPGHGFIHFGAPAHPPRHGLGRHFRPRPSTHHWQHAAAPEAAPEAAPQAPQAPATHDEFRTPHVPPLPGMPRHPRYDFRFPFGTHKPHLFSAPPPPPPPVQCSLPPLPPSFVCSRDMFSNAAASAGAQCEKQQQTTSVASVERSTSTDAGSSSILHPGVFCDGCSKPIHGVRYKCGNCSDYDLCGSCEATTNHNSDHLFIKIRKPHSTPSNEAMLKRVFAPLAQFAAAAHAPNASAATATVSATTATVAANDARALISTPSVQIVSQTPTQTVAETKKYVAHFVEDVTIPDGTRVGAGEPFVKIWSVANMGDSEWPRGTMLVHIDGKPGIPDNKTYVPVVVGKRYEQVGVAVDLVAPEAPGTYTSKWRLMTPEGHHFGAGLWCTIIVEPTTAATVATATATAPCVDTESRDISTSTSSTDKGKASDAASQSNEANNDDGLGISAAQLGKGTADAAIHRSASSSAVFVPNTPEQNNAPTLAKLGESAAASSSSPASAASAAASVAASVAGETASIASISSTFVKISADLMKEIQRLDASIKEIQQRQEKLDSESQAKPQQNSLSRMPSVSDSITSKGFDITSAPMSSAESPIKGYPAPLSPSQNYTSVDLLTSPPFTYTAIPQAPLPPQQQAPVGRGLSDGVSETSSMREFYSSADRLERLLNSSRALASRVTSSDQPQGQQQHHDYHYLSDEGAADEFEIVNDFAGHHRHSPQSST